MNVARLVVSITLLPLACVRAPVRPAPVNPTPVAAAPAVQSRPNTSAPAPVAPSDALPARLTDAEFWKLQADISEPGGYFQIRDNFTSNEMEVGALFTMLREGNVAGDVYMGVGPEQNFTYIASIRPRMAFIVDIRRQAVVQHLMFKAFFEMAKDRADFISLVFAKPRPPGLDTSTAIQTMWDAYRNVATDSALAARNFARVTKLLFETHGFTFTQDERETLKYVFDAFYGYGPSIATRGFANGRGGDFAELTGYSTDRTGQPRSFLSSEENYRTLKSLHERNLIVPVSGDFGGPKAVRAIGAYLTQHRATLRAFYVSNVEQYLFQDGKSLAFYENVASIPVDSASVFIRPYSMRRGFGGYTSGPTQSLCPIGAFIAAARAGRVRYNEEALACAK
jgi:hypothetical protein